MIAPGSLRWTAVLFVAVLSLSLTGCGGSKINKANYDKVNPGMTEADVEAILGKGEEKTIPKVDAPSVAVNMPGMNLQLPKIPFPSIKVWQDGQKAITITFMDGKVMMKGQTGL